MPYNGPLLKEGKTLKILFVSAYFPPELGGVESYVFNIARVLKQTHNVEVVVVTSNANGKEQICEVYSGIKVYRLPILIRISNTPINPLWYFLIKKIIQEEKPDLINSHQPVPFIGDIAALASGKTPFVLSYHSGTMRKNKLPADILINLYEKLILPLTAKKATKIICVSNFVRDTLLRNYAFKSTVINSAVDVSLFKPDANVNREENLILFVARYKKMYEMKGLHYLINAAKMLKGVRLRVVGEVDESINENVEFVGLKQGKDLVKEMQKAGLLVLPSIAPMESFGLVLLEAMACETPVVGTYMGGIPEVIRDGIDGFVVPAKDSEALALAISKIMVDKELAARMGHSGETKVREKYTWDICADLNKEVFTSCIQ